MSEKREEKKEKESKRLIAACILHILREETGWRLGNGDIKTLTPAEIYGMLERGCGSDRVYDGVHVKDEDTVRVNLGELLAAQEWTGVHCLEVDRLDDEIYREDRDPEKETCKTKHIHYYVLQEDEDTHLTQAEGAVLRSMLDSAVGIGAQTKKRILKKLDAISESSSKMIGRLEAANTSGLDFGAFSDAINEICKAIRSRACISFTYWAYRVDKQLHFEKTVLNFEPIQLITHRGGQYLLGREKDTHSLRHYRVDRMREVKPLHHLVSDPPPDSIDQYLARHPYLGEGALTGAELLVKREAISTVIDEFGLELTLREEGDDCCRVEIRHVVLEDLLKFALMHADGVEVKEPQELRKAILATADAMRMTYRSTEEDCYLAMLERARISRHAELILGGIDLSKRTEYKELRPEHTLTRAVFLNNMLKDISFLSENSAYHGLRKLVIFDNEVSDISPLTALRWLQHLQLHHTKVADISPLADSEIEELHLRDCPIGDYTPLRKMRRLRSLTVSLGIPESVVSALKKKGVKVAVIAPPTSEKPSAIDRYYRHYYNTVYRMTPADGE